MSWYRTGTASIANGATAVTGTLTAWAAQAKAEDAISFDGGDTWYEIAAVNSNTSITLATAFGGTTVSGGSYAIDRRGRGWSLTSELNASLASLLASVTHILAGAGAPADSFGANGDVYFDTVGLDFYGPKSGGAWPVAVSLNGNDGEDGNTLLTGSGAPSNGTGVNGDVYLDVAAKMLYGPKSAGAWPSGVSFAGSNGTDGKTVHSGSGAPSNGLGVDGDYYLDIGATTIYGPKASGVWPSGVQLSGLDGNPGLDWQGAWQTATGYVVNDGVSNGGSAYICTAPHTSGASTEPGVGASWASYWDVLALKGLDGEGVGDVVGPASATNNNLAQFDGTTGKLLEDSGVAISTDGTLAGNSDALVPTQKAVKAYADALIAAQDAMVFKGVIDCSANPNYPAADRGDTYRVSVAGKIGGGSGVNVEAGDILICLTDSTASGNHATVGAQWAVIQTNIDGALTTAAIGSTIQAYSARLAEIAALTPTDGNVIVGDGAGWVAESGGTARTSLGLGTGNSPQFTGVNVGHASDTPVTRSEAGVIAVAGVPLFSNIPVVSKSADATLVLSEAQKLIYHPGSDNNARTFTIPANASVAYPVGTCIAFFNSINTVTIAITSDTMALAGSGSTGSRTLAANGWAVALKIATTSWVIYGPGLT